MTLAFKQISDSLTRGISVSNSSVFEYTHCIQAELGDLKLQSYCGNSRKIWCLDWQSSAGDSFHSPCHGAIVNLGKLFNVQELGWGGSYWTLVTFWYLNYLQIFVTCILGVMNLSSFISMIKYRVVGQLFVINYYRSIICWWRTMKFKVKKPHVSYT